MVCDQLRLKVFIYAMSAYTFLKSRIRQYPSKIKILLGIPSSARRESSSAEIKLESQSPVFNTDPRYLSFSIDISILIGGFWWEGSMKSRRGLGLLRVPPFNLDSKKLDCMVSALGAAYLRVGGSDADNLDYFSDTETEENDLVLTHEIWDNLHRFIQRNELKFYFTIKYGLYRKELHGRWSGSEVEHLLRYSRDKGYGIDILELGNELNAYWAFHGFTAQPSARKLAADYHNFASFIKDYYPNAKIAGPGSAFWPRLGEPIAPFSNLTAKFLENCASLGLQLDIVDWHYYPFQSLRSPVRTRSARISHLFKPRTLNEFAKYARQLQDHRDEHYPSANLWTGETGSAQCGGQPKFSDRYASCFWWADQLGLGAINKQKVMIRQSLVGGDYGLIDRLTLKPRPDYWLSWLWKQLMGTRVYKVSVNHRLLRCYCHNTPGIKGRTLMIINMSAKPIEISVVNLGIVTSQFQMTAKRLKSKKIYINKIRPKLNKGNLDLSKFSASEINQRVEGHSINFWLLE